MHRAPKSQDIKTPLDLMGEAFRAELASGALIESEEFRARASLSSQALRRAVVANRLFFIECSGLRAYPAFYLDRRYVSEQLGAVTEALGDLPGGSKLQFFRSSKGSLARAEDGNARTPLQALEVGDFDAVRRAALGYAQR